MVPANATEAAMVLARRNRVAFRVLVESLENAVKAPVPDHHVLAATAYQLGRLEGAVHGLRTILDATERRG